MRVMRKSMKTLHTKSAFATVVPTAYAGVSSGMLRSVVREYVVVERLGPAV